MLKAAFSTLGCPDWTWQDLLHYGPVYGYDGVEIRLIERETDLLCRPEFAVGVRGRRRNELDAAMFSVCGLSSSVRFDYPEASERREQVIIGREYIDLAGELGASFVRVFGDTLPPNADAATRQATIGNIAHGLQTLGEYGEQHGVDILIETHGDYADSILASETLSRVESPAVGVLWDTHHPWRFCGEQIKETFLRLSPWIRHTHWKDSVSGPSSAEGATSHAAADAAHRLMSGHQHANYVPFGKGEFPAARCMSLLKGAVYHGWFSLEWEKMWHPELEGPHAILPSFPPAIRNLYEKLSHPA